MLILTASPMIIVCNLINNYDILRKTGIIYVYSVAILAILGWFQLISWYSTGSNPFPVGQISSLLGGVSDERGGISIFNTIEIYRMSSLAGEPRNLAGAFVFGLVLIQLQIFSHSKRNSLNIYILWLFLIFSLIATGSTTGFFLWFAATSIMLILGSVYIRIKIFYLLLILFISISLLSVYFDFSIYEYLLSRTVNRVVEADRGILEDFDSAIFDFLIENPINIIAGVGLGNAHIHANSYLSVEASQYAFGKVFVAKAHYLRLISESGFVGLLLFIYWLISLWKNIKYFEKSKYNIFYYNLSGFLLISIVIYLSFGSAANQFYLSVGAMMASIKIKRLIE
jgi:hypothetical protein